MSHDEAREPALLEHLPLDERHGPARRISSDAQAALITAALDQWQAPAPASVTPMWRSWAMAAAALLAVTMSARALYVWVAAQPPPETPSVAPSTRPVGAPPSTPATTPQPASAAEPEPETTTPSRSARAHGEPKVEVDHLLRANRLRAEGRYRDALHAYQRVITGGEGVSAYVARVAAASILLEQLHDPKAARALFRAADAQQTASTLDVEIQRGIAESSRQLGDATTERSALKLLLQRHPRTRAADAASERLKVIDGRP